MNISAKKIFGMLAVNLIGALIIVLIESGYDYNIFSQAIHNFIENNGMNTEDCHVWIYLICMVISCIVMKTKFKSKWMQLLYIPAIFAMSGFMIYYFYFFLTWAWIIFNMMVYNDGQLY